MYKIPISVLFAALIALSLVPCKKKKETTNTNELGTNSASNFAAADNLFGELRKPRNFQQIKRGFGKAGGKKHVPRILQTTRLGQSFSRVKRRKVVRRTQ